eukprot:9486856-Pyramimonas_sp.AAC.2
MSSGYPCVFASAARPPRFSLASPSGCSQSATKKVRISASEALASLRPVLTMDFDCTRAHVRTLAFGSRRGNDGLVSIRVGLVSVTV